MSEAGFGRCDITPHTGCLLYGYIDDLESESIHDRLWVSAFYFEDGGVSSFMITADVCSINTEVAKIIRRAVSEKTGVKYENIILHGIHNHTGPNTDGNTGWGALDTEYCFNILLPKTVEACIAAKNGSKEALMGINIGESRVAVNRREYDRYNNIQFGQCDWGSFDPRMAVILFTDTCKNPIASLVFYTCHGTCAGLCKEISRDFSGAMTDMLEELTGAPAAFFCGAEGDVGPRLDNKQTVGTIRDVEIMGARAGTDAVRICKGINSLKPLTMRVKSGELTLPLKKRIPLEKAKELYDEFRDNSVNLEGQKRSYALKVIDSYKTDYEEKESRIIPQTAIVLNDTVFVSFPYELFSEIALRIDRYTENYHVFSLSNANGSEGYFPCDSEISKGGYEIDMFLTLNVQPFSDNADYHLITETLKNLEDLLCTE